MNFSDWSDQVSVWNLNTHWATLTFSECLIAIPINVNCQLTSGCYWKKRMRELWLEAKRSIPYHIKYDLDLLKGDLLTVNTFIWSKNRLFCIFSKVWNEMLIHLKVSGIWSLIHVRKAKSLKRSLEKGFVPEPLNPWCLCSYGIKWIRILRRIGVINGIYEGLPAQAATVT